MTRYQKSPRLPDLVVVALLLSPALAGAQSPSATTPAAATAAAPSAALAGNAALDPDAVFAPNEPARDSKAGKIIHAYRLMSAPPQIDGRLNDEVWGFADALAGFTQSDPDNGREMSESTRIQVAYDDRFLYIAVTCLDSDPRGVIAGMSRRDEQPATDLINIGLDPRHDHLTGYVFQTNPSSWQGDMSLYDDDRSDRDFNVNWEVRSQITGSGWTAEFRIPFSQMRFTAQPTPGQVWGFDARRAIRRKGEVGFWVSRPRGERGDTSRFGHLVFDAPLTPPGRLEILPYALTRAERSPSTAGDIGLSGGADIRYGVGPGSTLSATINPDFGQVEQDPAVLNLSIYETFFPEKRAFFLEDNRTFVPPYSLLQVFHSRRIGRTPDRIPLQDGDQVIHQPAETTILGAGKFTGKSRGWTYGGLTAATSREYAEVMAESNGPGSALVRTERLIEPATSYNVVRVQRDIRGSSNIGAIATGVVREQLEDAFTGGIDYNIRWDRNRAGVNGHWVATHAPIDGVMKTGGGGVANFTINRKRWDAGIHGDHFSPDFRISDLGFFRTRVDRTRVDGSIEAGQPDPGPRFRNYWFGTYMGQSWNDAGLVFERNAEVFGSLQFLNFWRINGGTGREFAALDDLDTRGGPPIARAAGQYAWFNLNSDTRKRWTWNLNLNGGIAGYNGSRNLNVNSGLSLQPSDRVQTSISAGVQSGSDQAQWIENVDATGDGETDYVYGSLRRHVIDLTFRATYAFNRDLTLQAYLQPFVAVGDYFNTRRLARPRSFDFEPVTLDTDPDFNSKSLRSNVVLRWEYVKGSTLFIVWNMSQSDDSRPGRFSPFRDLGSAFAGGDPTNVFMVKASYWINR